MRALPAVPGASTSGRRLRCGAGGPAVRGGSSLSARLDIVQRLAYVFGVSEALQALYTGDEGRAQSLLRPDPELTVFEAAAFGRIDSLRSLLDQEPILAQELSEDGFTPLHSAVFGRQ